MSIRPRCRPGVGDEIDFYADEIDINTIIYDGPFHAIDAHIQQRDDRDRPAA